MYTTKVSKFYEYFDMTKKNFIIYELYC